MNAAEVLGRLFGAEYRYRVPTLGTSPYQRRFKNRKRSKTAGAFGLCMGRPTLRRTRYVGFSGLTPQR